jgi:type IV secretion system protein VirB8
VIHACISCLFPVIAGVRVAYREMRRAPEADQPTRCRRCKQRSFCTARDHRGEASAMRSSAVVEAYFQEAESWDADRSRRLRRSATIAWWVAAAGWTCAIASAIAILGLTPLKQVEPFVVRVDNSTGIVDVVPVYAGKATPEEAVSRYFLAHYLTICERFNFSTAESDYEECGAFHSAQRNQAWFSQWTATNPASPLNIFKDGSSVRVQVKSVSFFTRSSGLTDLAQVRYLKALRQAGGSDEKFTHWVATLQFAYVEPAKDPKARRWNPLGFKVVDFKTEPEVEMERSDKDAHHEK